MSAQTCLLSDERGHALHQQETNRSCWYRSNTSGFDIWNDQVTPDQCRSETVSNSRCFYSGSVAKWAHLYWTNVTVTSQHEVIWVIRNRKCDQMHSALLLRETWWTLVNPLLDPNRTRLQLCCCALTFTFFSNMTSDFTFFRRCSASTCSCLSGFAASSFAAISWFVHTVMSASGEKLTWISSRLEVSGGHWWRSQVWAEMML